MAHLTIRPRCTACDAGHRCGILPPPRQEETAISPLIPIDDLNAATPLPALLAGPMPNSDFFTRSNFGTPDADPNSWTMAVSGLVDTPRSFSLDELRALGEATEVVTVECAGNGRRLMDPLPEGVAWSLGAVSVAEFTGVPLRRVLDAVGPAPNTVDFVFTGADHGVIDGAGEINYEFSLPAEVAIADGPLLIWAMNGEPLPPERGGPLRLLVPGHYGMTSVKWLAAIEAIGEAYDGYFRERYRFFKHPEVPDGSKVGRMWVRSLITSPEDGASIGAELDVGGVAWSGSGPISSVAVRVDDGEWVEAQLGPQDSAYRPVAWSIPLPLDSGDHVIAARATDEAGDTQPLSVPWNSRGYANNAVHRVAVTVA